MKRTSPVALVVAGLIGAGLGFVTNQLLTVNGRPTFTPAVTLPIVLIVLAVITLAAGISVRRSTSGLGRRVDPFRAMRIAVFARASSLVGAVATGFAGGLIVFLVTRPVVPAVSGWATVIATAVCGVILMSAALYAEYLCTIRKDDDDEQPGPRAPGTAPHDH